MAFIVAGLIAGGIGAIGGIGGALISSNGAKDAAGIQADATRQGLSYLGNLDQPYIQAGESVLPQMSQMASQTPNFTPQDFLNNMDPAYGFDMQQGLQAVQRSAAAKGSLMSGGTLKDLNNYAQGQASNEYQNAYSRFMNNQNTRFGRLSSIAGLGQSGAAQMGQLGTEMITGNANAQAGSQIAQGNIWGNTLSGLGSGIGNNVMSGAMMNRFFPQQTQQTQQAYSPMNYSNPETGYAAGPLQYNGTYNSSQATMPQMDPEL